MFGVLNRDRTHIDVSKTLRGAKNYATRHGYKEVSKRVEYNIVEIHHKVGKKWEVKND